ncbi:DUF2934 domain-containing protein [Neorhizobium alkalisoli]|uniref:DUF2934 domain-containing protein n=1 Tax=Neorhizobium alkalisoli TaxID=528178 RepID=UPI001FE0767F|nr:DUF2934 domain-containing protein [Neorhizobium alkalisoli]
MDKEQERRERAYRIWEAEGRPEGLDQDHWRRAEEKHEATDREGADVTHANQQASDTFNDARNRPGSPTDVRPPSTVSPD